MRIDSILHNQHLTSGVCACENDDSLAAYTYLTSTPSSLPCGMYATDDTRPRTHDDPVVTSLPKASHSLSTKTASFAPKKNCNIQPCCFDSFHASPCDIFLLFLSFFSITTYVHTVLQFSLDQFLDFFFTALWENKPHVHALDRILPIFSYF